MSLCRLLQMPALFFGLMMVVAIPARAEELPIGPATGPESVPETDEILLKNGSRILGTIVDARDGLVNIDTEFAGAISVYTESIRRIRTTEDTTLLLADDKVLTSDTIRITEDTVVVGAPVDDPRSYDIEDLEVINPEAWELGEGYKWTGLLSFAWSKERGNSNTDELDYKLETVWRSKRDRYTIKLYGEIDEANDQKNADNWNAIAKYDYFVSDQTYWGFNLFAESDEFADLDLRYFAGPYIGREFYTDPLFMLAAEIGLAYVNEDFIVAEDQEYPATNWSLNISSNYLGGDSRLYLDQLGVWNLDDTSDVFVNTSIGLAFPLLWNFEAAAEILLEYDSGAVEGVNDMDETYRFRVGYSW